MKSYWNKPVKIGFFIKIFIVLNALFIALFMKVAYISDYKSEQDQKYQNYLENRIEVQSELIKVQRELLNKYKNNL